MPEADVLSLFLPLNTKCRRSTGYDFLAVKEIKIADAR
jgi:hypothetical protein